MTDGSSTMGVREGNRPFRKTLKVRGLDSRVIIEWRNVVIQVVNRDEEDMRFSNDGESDEQEEGDDWKERAHGDRRERKL
jgi:hypothetical protein